MAEKPKCFVIAPIGTEGSDTRIRSDQILKYVIRPVAEQCGYDAIRADQISEPGLITTQVINHILNDPMVVADITGDNANVFYELAIRHVIRLPYVQMIRKGDRIPFDVAAVRTILVNHQDLDSVEQAKAEMKKQMEYTAQNKDKIESPISATIDLEALKKSGDPEKRQVGQILQGISELKNMIVPREVVIPNVISPRLQEILKRAAWDEWVRNPESRRLPGGMGTRVIVGADYIEEFWANRLASVSRSEEPAPAP